MPYHKPPHITSNDAGNGGSVDRTQAFNSRSERRSRWHGQSAHFQPSAGVPLATVQRRTDHGALAAFQINRGRAGEIDRACAGKRRLVGDDLAAMRRRAKPGGDVDAVADDGEIEPTFRPQKAGDDRSGVETDADLQRQTGAHQSPLQRLGGGNRPLLPACSFEASEYAVADDLVDIAELALDLLDLDRNEPIEDCDSILRLRSPRKRS